MGKIDQSVFKAYDIRGIYPDQINSEVAYLVGKAFATYVNDTLVVGRDMRKSSNELFNNFSKGANEVGIDVINLGICTTPMLNFAVANNKYKIFLQGFF